MCDAYFISNREKYFENTRAFYAYEYFITVCTLIHYTHINPNYNVICLVTMFFFLNFLST